MKLMKFVVFLIMIANTIHISASESSFENNSRFSENAVIYQLFEKFRNLLKLGDVEKDIPILDPYMFSTERAQILKLFDGKVKSEVNITHGLISGFSNFRLEDFTLIRDELALDLIVKIPRIKLDAEFYEMDGQIFETLPIMGSGILYFVVKDLIVTSKLYLNQSEDGKSVVIDKLHNTSFTIEQILSRTQYNGNIDNVLNAMTEDLLAGYLTRFSKYIANTYKDDIVHALNTMLNGYDTWSILATILQH